MKRESTSKRAAILAVLILNSACLLFFAGCNLAPAYHPPVVQTPPAYKETNGWKLAQPSDAVLKGKWWEMFNNPQLNYLEEQVAVSNQNVIASLQNFFAARALVKGARAAYFPTVAVNPSVTKSHSGGGSTGVTSSSSGITFANRSSTSTFYDLPADATWQPDFWGLVRNTVKADAFAAQASAATLADIQLTAQAELAEDFYQLRGQDQLIKLYDDTVKAYRDTLDLTTTLYQTGIDSELNEAQADALLETTIAQATALGIQRAQYEHAIALLVGQPASTFSLNTAPITDGPPLVPVGLPSALLERRPDVATSERAVAQANALIGVARAAWFPTVSLTGSAGYESTSLSSLISPPSFFWSVGATLSETVFDGGKRWAANQQAWANYRSTVAAYRETVLTAFQQVEDDLAAIRILSAQFQQENVAIKASQKNYDLSLEQYHLGVASYLNVISAQETLLANQQTAVSVQVQQLVDTVQLIMALGGGWNTADLPSPGKLALKSSPGGK